MVKRSGKGLVFSPIYLFSKRDLIPATACQLHSHTQPPKGTLPWTILSLQMFPLQGHTKNRYIHFPEKNAIMEVFLSVSEVISSLDGVG